MFLKKERTQPCLNLKLLFMKIQSIIIPALLVSSLSLAAQKSTKPFGSNSVDLLRPTGGSTIYTRYSVDPDKNKDPFNFVNCWIEPMSSFNSKFPEYTPVYSSSTHTMFFTARRQENIGNKKTIDLTYKAEDIYFSTKDSDGKWSKVSKVYGKINTSKNEAITWISADGKKMILCQNEDLFESKFLNGEWTKPEPISLINSGYRETHASYSADGNTIYFTTNNPELATVGGMDICMIECDPSTGNWGTPQIVPNINSSLNEDDPTLMADGKTLYFSSQGFSSIGGYDIFSSILRKDGFSAPKNLGFPINTEANEPFISVADDGKRAFISSDRGESKEQNIYEVTFLDQIKVPMLVEVYDSKTNQLINSDIKLIDVKKSEELIYMDNVTRGVFATDDLNLETHYRLNVTAKEYEGQELVVSTSGYGKFDPDTFKLIEKVYLTPSPISKEVPTDLLMNLVHFDFGKASLSLHSIAIVEKIKTFLLENPDAQITINGHTDNKGSNDLNLILSQKRGNAVADWFKQNGIDMSRITVIGHGEEKPIMDNATEKGRTNNRRAEIEVVFVK